MIELLVAALALGLAGIDPAGLLIALGALAAGARERTVLAFTTVVIVGTALLGTALSLTLGRQLQDFDWTSLLPPDWLGAVVEIVIAVALLAWALVLGAVLFAASAPLDPTFVGLVVLAGRGESPTAVALAHTTWIVVSQLPLVVLAVAVLLRRHDRAVAWLRDLLPRARPVLARLGTLALVLAGTVMATDAGWWIVTGEFLLPDPT